MAIPTWFRKTIEKRKWTEEQIQKEWHIAEKELVSYPIQALQIYRELSKFYDAVWKLDNKTILDTKQNLINHAGIFYKRAEAIEHEIYRRYSNLNYGSMAPAIRGSILYRNITPEQAAGYYFYRYDVPISKNATSKDLKTPRTLMWTTHPFIAESLNLEDALMAITNLIRDLLVDIETWSAVAIPPEFEEYIGIDSTTGKIIYYLTSEELYKLYGFTERVVNGITVRTPEELTKEQLDFLKLKNPKFKTLQLTLTYSCETGGGSEPYYAEITANTIVTKSNAAKLDEMKHKMEEFIDQYRAGNFEKNFGWDLANLTPLLKEGIEYRSKVDSTLTEGTIHVIFEQKEHTFTISKNVYKKSRKGKKPYSPDTEEYEVETEKVE